MKRDALSIGIARVRDRFVEKLYERSQCIDQLRFELHLKPDNQEALHKIGQISHKIAGTAATVGFPKLGESAAKIDSMVLGDLSSIAVADGELFERIDLMRDIMQDILQGHESVSLLPDTGGKIL